MGDLRLIEKKKYNFFYKVPHSSFQNVAVFD